MVLLTGDYQRNGNNGIVLKGEAWHRQRNDKGALYRWRPL